MLGILLLVVLVLAFTGQFQVAEGFAAEPSAATATVALPRGVVRCPPTYNFFSAPDGTSLCCKGTVNPYTGTCEGASAQNDICSLGGSSVKDPRPAFRGENLPSCKELIITNLTASSIAACPPSLPNFAKQDAENEKCCANRVALYGENGFTCSAEDLKDTTKYCVAKGAIERNSTDGQLEMKCEQVGLLETAKCPAEFQTVPYTMGAREKDKYDIADLAGLTIPTCYRLNEACIPKDAISYAQARGAYTEYNPAKWEYSCEVWEKKKRGENVADLQTGYLT